MSPVLQLFLTGPAVKLPTSTWCPKANFCQGTSLLVLNTLSTTQQVLNKCLLTAREVVSKSDQPYYLSVDSLTWPFPGVEAGSASQTPDVQSLRILLESEGACGRWLTCSNQKIPFISPPVAGSPGFGSYCSIGAG